MSDNTSDEEQQQQMEEIFICEDIWMEVFALLSPRELGLKVALISDGFDSLVDMHFKLRKWSLGPLQIVRSTDGNGAQIVNNNSGQLLPIPQGPIPSKVIGFEKIEIRYIDRSVIEFLQRLRPLFDSSGTTVAIATSADQSRSWDIIRQKIWPLINDNIRHLRVCAASQLDRLRQDFPAILRNCTKLQLIDAHEFIAEPGAMPIGLFPEFPADDNANASSNKALAKWLLTSRHRGLPKILSFGRYSGGGMDELKEAFVNASEPANFIMRLTPNILNHVRWTAFWAMSVPLFELTNNLGERLKFRREGWPFLLVRCPIERDEDKWAVWEKEAMEWEWSRQWNRIVIHFNDSDIGDGMLDANDKGPTE